jgi:hypothetical protein
VLFVLWIAAIVVVIIAWFAILFTGRYPRGMFDLVEGVFRWATESSHMPSCCSPTATHPSLFLGETNLKN